ncbi:hypothetical protein, partial [Oceanobacillus damuensis]|uniref:hypothetical protein n=1 Tax=Oceanobacillus damuensis TaxID=937928 RepID=UPI000B1CC85A
NPCCISSFYDMDKNITIHKCTRAKEKVVFVGSEQAIQMAIKNDTVAQRNSKLAERIQGYLKRKEKKSM